VYDIITTEDDDQTVMAAVDAIIQGVGVVPATGGNYVFRTPTAARQSGNGGRNENILVVVGHASADRLSGMRNWSAYKSEFPNSGIQWNTKTAVYLVACSTAGQGNTFLHGNFAGTVKAAFPHAVVWASESPVNALHLTGSWVRL